MDKKGVICMSTAKAVVKPVVVTSETINQDVLCQVEQGILLKRALDGYNEVINACLLSFPETEHLQHSIETLQKDIAQRFDTVLKALCSQ